MVDEKAIDKLLMKEAPLNEADVMEYNDEWSLVKKKLLQKTPWINITRTKGIVTALKSLNTNVARLADAVEMLLLEAYGYQSKPPETDTSGPEPQVMYTDQDEHDINEIVKAAQEK